MKFAKFKESIENYNPEIFLHPKKGSARNLELILQINNKMNSTLVLDEVLETVLKSALSFTQSERGFIVLQSDDSSLRYALGYDDNGSVLHESAFKVSMSVINEVFDSGEALFLESAISGNNAKSRKSVFSLKLETILCAPLITSNKKIGVIYVDSKKLKNIKDKEITDTFEIFAGQAATAIRNAQLFKSQLNSYNALQRSTRELLKTKEEVEKSDRLKSEFLAQMSHEIRTPIHVINSNAALIKDELEGKLSDEINGCFDSISNAGRRIIRTTELILNMTEIQAGTYKINESEFYLIKDILYNIYSEYGTIAKTKNLLFQLEINCNDRLIKGDRYSICQIFTQLIDNAVKYTEDGTVKIIINSKNDKILVSVEDTGIGISKEYINDILSPFTQEEQGYSRSFEGNGLGLALVDGFCKLNNFGLDIESQKEIGSKFTVVL